MKGRGIICTKPLSIDQFQFFLECMRRLLQLLLLSIAGLLAVACDQSGRPVEQVGLDKLTRGLSTESDVRMVMGQPHSVWEESDGSRMLEYPKGPEGARTWIFRIDQFGKLQNYQQVLTPENFARIKPGMSKEEVRRILGTPGSTMQFERKNEEGWTWRYLDGTDNRYFHAYFDSKSGQITRTESSQDSFG